MYGVLLINQNFERQNSRGGYKNNYRGEGYSEVEIGTSLWKDHFLETLVTIETIGVQAIVGLGQDQG